MIPALDRLAPRPGPARPLWGLRGVLASCSRSAPLAGPVLPRLRPGKDYTNLRQRVWSWWVMVALLAGALVLGWQATLVAVRADLVPGAARVPVAGAGPARGSADHPRSPTWPSRSATAWSLVNQYGIYLVFIPVWVFLITPFLMALIGQTRNYLHDARPCFHWGQVACVYNIGFVALLMRTPRRTRRRPAGRRGWCSCCWSPPRPTTSPSTVWGKLFGRHKIMPTVSPNKTWEGFLGGWATTAALIWLVGPDLRAAGRPGPGDHGRALPLAGFAGDVTMSAVKRDIGVKDTSAPDPRPRRHAGPDRQPDLHRAALFPPDGLLRPAPMSRRSRD